MIAVYIRVSDKEQNLELQRIGCKVWLGDQKAEFFEDKQTGKNLDRPGFKALQKAIADGKVKTVVVWKLDRLSRTMKDGVRLLADWLDQGVRVVSVTQGFDFSGTIGQLIANLLFAFAEIEWTHLHERQAAGIAVAKSEGKYTGRKPGTRKANPQRARELKEKGLTIPEIAASLKVAKSTVSEYLKQSSAV